MKQNFFVCIDQFYGRKEGLPFINRALIMDLCTIIKNHLLPKGFKVTDAKITFFTKKADHVCFSNDGELQFFILNKWISATDLESLMRAHLQKIPELEWKQLGKYLSNLEFSFVDHAHSHKVTGVDIYPNNEIVSSRNSSVGSSRANSLETTPDLTPEQSDLGDVTEQQNPQTQLSSRANSLEATPDQSSSSLRTTPEQSDSDTEVKSQRPQKQHNQSGLFKERVPVIKTRTTSAPPENPVSLLDTSMGPKNYRLKNSSSFQSGMNSATKRRTVAPQNPLPLNTTTPRR